MKEKTIWKPIAILLAVILCFSFHFALPVSADYENTHVNTGDQATDLVEVARTQVGYHEGTNNYTKYNVWFGSLNDYGYNYAWCQTFVAWCANQAGIPTSMIPRVSGTISGMDFFKKNETWKDAGITPEKGDIIYLHSKSSSGYHVGIVADVFGGQISTIEGNSSDRVAERSYSVGNSSIVGYGCPEYVRPNPNPPTNLSIQSDKSYYSMGETIQFTFTSDYATELYIPIDVNGKRKFFMDVTGRTSYSCTFDEAGDYGFYLVARNAYGEATAKYMDFKIYDTVPQNLTIETDKKIFKLGESINFKFSCDYETELYIPVDINGKRKFFIDVTGKDSYSCSFDEIGTYGFYLVARNAYGEATAKYMEFKIISPIQGDLNQDGTLSLTDLIPLQQSLLRQTTLTADQAQLADYNDDGSINVLDLMFLKRALLS